MFTIIVSVLLSLNSFDSPSQAPAKPSPRENVDTAIAEAIRQLEAKDYKTFLSEFVPPADLKALAGTPEALDSVVQLFPAKAERLLTALKNVRAQKPAYDESRTSATFQVALPDMPSSMTFVKIGAYWYLANK